MTALRFAELFAGVGGLGMGLERAGMHGVWRAELADFPRRVLRHRYPDAPLYGDVSALDGRALVDAHGPFDLLAGGSPCQDLSVAGKRAGLAGARSGLFHHQVRLWQETGAPYCLWENVLGALSSNSGADFAAVLSAFVGAPVPVPADGWGSAGVVAGPAGVACFRVLDAQWFGVPQRRRRVFVLAARAGGVDPATVLLEPDGVRWDSAPRREAGERVADSLTVGANQTCGFPGDDVAGEDGNGGGLDFFQIVDSMQGAGGNRAWLGSHEPHQTLNANDKPNAIAFREKLGAISAGRVSPALMADTGATGNMHPSVVCFDWQNSPSQGMAVLAFNSKQDGADASEVAPTLLAMPHDASHANGGGQLAVCVTGQRTHALTSEGADASEDGTGRGTPIVAPAYFDKQALGVYGEGGVASTLAARDYKDATDLIIEATHGSELDDSPLASTEGLPAGAVRAVRKDRQDGRASHQRGLAGQPAGEPGAGVPELPSLGAQQAPLVQGGWVPDDQPAPGLLLEARAAFPEVGRPARGEGESVYAGGIPRRLTPKECERLMSWPDGWTDVPDAKGKPASDAVRYKACGNGVASCCTHWIGERFVAVAA